MDIHCSRSKVECVLLMMRRTKSCAWRTDHRRLKVVECKRYVGVQSEETTFGSEKMKRIVAEEERICECCYSMPA